MPETPLISPLPPLALNVGVGGHRPAHLADGPRGAPTLQRFMEQMFECVDGALKAIAADPRAALCYAPDGGPVRRVLSPLAEGADRLGAIAGLAQGWALVAALPMPREDYEADFTGGASQLDASADSVAEFRTLLAQAVEPPGTPAAGASRIVEFDGQRVAVDQAYAASARFVTHHSDLVIGIWDGEDATSIAGTAPTLAEAYRQGRPILWLRPQAPFALSLVPVRAPDGSQFTDDEACQRMRSAAQTISADLAEDDDWPETLAVPLRAVLEECLLPPALLDVAGTRMAAFRDESGLLRDADRARDYASFYEGPIRLRRPWPGPLARVFHLLGRLVTPDHPHPEQRTDERPAQGLPDAVPGDHPALARVFDALQVTDRLAAHYASAHRSLYVVLYCAAGLALICAVCALFFAKTVVAGVSLKLVFTLTELVALLTILAGARYEHHAHWHERWIDYRAAAELFRSMLLLPLVADAGLRWQARLRALETVDPDLPDGWSLGEDDRRTLAPRAWTQFHYEAVLRWAGPLGLRYDAATLPVIRTYLAQTAIAEQIHYNRVSGHRANAMGRRLLRLSQLLFAATMALVCGKLAAPLLTAYLGMPDLAAWAGLGAALLPAGAAISFGVRSHAEFSVVAKRARTTLERLRRHQRAILLSSLNVDALQRVTRRSAITMRTDAYEWADLFEEKETHVE